MKINFLRNLLIALSSISLFTFLFIKAQAINFNRHNSHISDLRRINEIDAKINQNVLQSRYGLLTSYDPITDDLKEWDILIERLTDTPNFIDSKTDSQLQEFWQEYIELVRKKERLIEDFNAANAIVKNSLTYLPIAVANTVGKDTAATGYQQFIILNNLLRDILIYNASPREELINKIDLNLENIIQNQEQLSYFLNSSDLDIVILHSQIVLQYQPQVNHLIREIIAVPTNQRGDELYDAYERGYQRALVTTNIYRFLLYLLSILLLTLIGGYIIIKLRKSAAAIREAEEKYRSIFENSLDGIFQITPEGKYLSVNPALAKIHGWSSPEEFLANVTEIERQVYVFPHRWEEFKTAIEKQGYVSEFESQVYRQDHKIIWISESASAVEDSDNNLLYYEGIVTDITARKQAEVALKLEQRKSESLLLNILPEPIAKRLKQNYNTSIAEHFEEATVLFADIVGFTQLSAQISPTELVDILNKIFSAFDLLVEKHGLEKIKTIGDSYMAVGGLPMPRPDNAEAIAEMALHMLAELSQFNQDNNKSFKVRIGIHTGPVVAGVIGIKKFIYDLWGDTVNIASRMESHGIPDRIQMTEKTYQILQDKYLFEPRGSIPIKGKGEMLTYFLVDRIM